MDSLGSSSEINMSIESSDVPCSHINTSTTLQNDSSFNENLIIDEMESYLDNLSSRLIVSRIVTDSVIKGIVNAVEQEAAEQSASKDAEITVLNQKLQEVGSAKVQGSDLLQNVANSEAQMRCSSDANSIYKYAKHLGMLKTEMQCHLQRLQKEIENNTKKDFAEKFIEINELVDALDTADAVDDRTHDIGGSLGPAISEQQWELEFQNETTSILLMDFVKDLQNKFQTGIHHSKSVSLALAESRDKIFDELHSIRQQLDTISKSVLNSEWGFLVSQYSFEGLEDGNKHRVKEQSSKTVTGKENGALSAKKSEASTEEVFGNPSKLKHMDNEALIAHFNKMMNEMKRQHDSAVQEKTEEIFALKRVLLKEKGSSPSHFRNNKEFEQMKKTILELMLKLDEILLENKNSIARVKVDAFPGHQEKSNTIDSGVQELQDPITDKEKEVGCISSQANETSHFMSIEADYVKHIKKLEADIEDARTDAITREDIEKIVVRELVSQLEMHLQGFEMESKMKQDIFSIIQNQAIAEAMSDINSSLLKCREEKSSAETASLQIQEIKKLKLVVDSFNKVLKEKEEDIEFKAMKAHIDSLCYELGLLREKVMNQGCYISEKNREFDIIMGRLEKALHQVHCNEMTLSELNGKFRNALDSLKEVEKQKSILHGVIEEKEKALTLTFSKETEFKKCMKSVVISVTDFGNFILDNQSKIVNKIQYSESRLGLLKDQCNHLVKQGYLLRKKALQYKEVSEIRGSNLQKAELEVDLLGDEVEALTDLLGKIYIALDHYSPVLQHYTGVMEILNMIKRAIKVAK